MPAGTTNAEMPVSVRAVTVVSDVIGGAAVGDERLRPVDHPLAVLKHGAGAGGAGVGAAVGLGESEPTERTPGDEVGQPLGLLVVGAELEDRVGAEADAGRQRDAQRLVDAAELLDRHAQRGEVATGAAVLLGEHDAEQTELAHRPHDVDREVVVTVPLRSVRRDLGLGELAHRLTQHLVLVAQLPCHRATSDLCSFMSCRHGCTSTST